MALTPGTPPAQMPIDLADLKLELRITGTDQDGPLARHLATATEFVQNLAGRQLISRTFTLELEALSAGETISLPRPPVSAITSARSFGTDDAATALVEDTDFRFEAGEIRPRLLPQTAGVAGSWPAMRRTFPVAEVVFVAGYGAAAADVPSDLVSAVVLVAGHLFENRAGTTAQKLEELPLGVESLVAPYRADIA